mgnify:FL=1
MIYLYYTTLFRRYVGRTEGSGQEPESGGAEVRRRRAVVPFVSVVRTEMQTCRGAEVQRAVVSLMVVVGMEAEG